MAGNTTSDILVAGAIAAFTVDLLVYPLDTLKTRIQSPSYNKLYIDATTNSVNKARLFRGLYQGVFSVIIATLPSSGAFFTTYEWSKKILGNVNPVLKERGIGIQVPLPVVHAIASSVAELVSCAILTPAEVIKQNAQMVEAAKASASSATLQTLRRFRERPTRLFSGYTALAGRNLPFTALQFPVFEGLKVVGTRWRESKGKAGGFGETMLVTGVSAGVAGTIAAVVTTPVDVVKTRIMLKAGEEGERDSMNKGGDKGKGKLVDAFGSSVKESTSPRKANKSLWAVGREVVAEKGVIGLWRGGALRGIWTFLGSGLYLGTYESGRIYLARRRGESIDEEDLL